MDAITDFDVCRKVGLCAMRSKYQFNGRHYHQTDSLLEALIAKPEKHAINPLIHKLNFYVGISISSVSLAITQISIEMPVFNIQSDREEKNQQSSIVLKMEQSLEEYSGKDRTIFEFS